MKKYVVHIYENVVGSAFIWINNVLLTLNNMRLNGVLNPDIGTHNWIIMHSTFVVVFLRR